MYYTDELLGTMFFIGIISALITGCIADTIAKKKNQKGFAWGFFLSWIGIIVVACMPADNTNNNKPKSKYERLEQLGELRKSNTITEEEFNREKARILNS